MRMSSVRREKVSGFWGIGTPAKVVVGVQKARRVAMLVGFLGSRRMGRRSWAREWSEMVGKGVAKGREVLSAESRVPSGVGAAGDGGE